MHSKMMQWSRGVYLAGMVLALILVIPTAWFPFQLAKVAVFAVCLLVSAILFVLGVGARELARAHGFKGALLVALLPLAYLLSTFFSVDRSVAFVGYAVDSDTVLFVVLAAAALVMGFALFRTLRTVRLLIMTIFWALVAAAIFQFVSIVFGAPGAISQTFADRSVNLVGKWNDLGLLIGLLISLIIVRLEFSETPRIPQVLLVVLAAALGTLLAIINFPLAWILLLVVSLGVALVSFLTARSERMHGGSSIPMRALVPWMPLVTSAIAIIFLVYGSAVNTGLIKFFPVSSLEVRPSYSATTAVISAARGSSLERLVIGTGPNTFGEEWLQYKPSSVNQSDFWDLDFNVGFSSITTAFESVGLLGAILWLLPAALVLAAVLRVARLSLLTREDKAAAIGIAISALFFAGALILYVPSPNLILIGFALAGAAFGFFWRQGRTSAEEIPGAVAYTSALIIALFIVVLSAWGSFVSVRRVIAESLVGQGSAALSAGNIDGALASANSALKVERTGDTLRFALTAGSAKLNAISQDTTTPAATLQSEFSTTLQTTLSAGQAAMALNPKDYRPTFALAQIYDFLTTLKVTGAQAQAAAAYSLALAQDPTNPQIPLLMARFAASNNDGPDTQKFLQQSLTLKPNYTDAMLLVVQLAVAQNDLNTAVKAAQAAVQSAPGVPSLWFELGLLLYSGNDTKDAVPVLKQALTLESDYANAQYFLGLSEYAQGDTQDAVAQFEDLQKSNQGNSEVSLILSNMQAGQPAFASSTPPVSTPPQDRTTAPISQ